MWTENRIFLEDLENIKSDKNISWEEFEGKTIFVTGATGLIGYSLVSSILYSCSELNNPPKVTALVRSIEKAERMFKEQIKIFDNLKFVKGDVTNPPEIEGDVDYIVHGASMTASKDFVERPVEIIHTAMQGTENMLKLAAEKKSESMLYLSSMEVYGVRTTEEKIFETDGSMLDTMTVRSSYPESKRMCESLCCSYAAEYGVNVNVSRLTQTFGPGVEYNDGRVFAEFIRCANEKRDIVLHTKGETKRNYLYISDAVRAIATILLSKKSGEAYNVANEATYMSIYEMAELVADKCANGMINVVCEVEEDLQKYGYAPTLKMNLDTSKLRSLGWNASVELNDMYMRTMESMKYGLK